VDASAASFVHFSTISLTGHILFRWKHGKTNAKYSLYRFSHVVAGSAAFLISPEDTQLAQ